MASALVVDKDVFEALGAQDADSYLMRWAHHWLKEKVVDGYLTRDYVDKSRLPDEIYVGHNLYLNRDNRLSARFYLKVMPVLGALDRSDGCEGARVVDGTKKRFNREDATPGPLLDVQNRCVNWNIAVYEHHEAFEKFWETRDTQMISRLIDHCLEIAPISSCMHTCRFVDAYQHALEQQLMMD